MLSQHDPQQDRRPKIQPELTLLFGQHGSQEDIAWRVQQVEKAVRDNIAASRHLLIAECNVPSTLPNTVAELQEMYNQARLQYPRLPSVEWATELRSGVLESASQELLRSLHAQGINEFIKRCDEYPDGSHELKGRPGWMPVAELLSQLRAKGINIKCGFELYPFEAYVLELRSSLIQDELNHHVSAKNLFLTLHAFVTLQGLMWKSDKVRDRGIAQIVQGFLVNNPSAHIIIERGSAHRYNITEELCALDIRFSTQTLDDDGRIYVEVDNSGFWEDSDNSPTVAHMCQAFREIMRTSVEDERKLSTDQVALLSARLKEVEDSTINNLIAKLQADQVVDADWGQWALDQLRAMGREVL